MSLIHVLHSYAIYVQRMCCGCASHGMLSTGTVRSCTVQELYGCEAGSQTVISCCAQHLWAQVEELPGAEAGLWAARRRLAQTHPQVRCEDRLALV